MSACLAIDLPVFTRVGATLDIDVADDARAFTASGAILTDNWVPDRKATSSSASMAWSSTRSFRCWSHPARLTFGFFPVFIEGLDGQFPTLESESNVLPERYVND